MEYGESGVAYDRDLERHFLGSAMIKYESIKNVLAETKITADSFYLDTNRNVFRAIMKLFDENKPPNEPMVSSLLNGTVPTGYIHELTEQVPVPYNVGHYANRLVELEKWRNRRIAALEAVKATDERDIESFAKAKQRLDNDEVRTNSINDPTKLGESFESALDSPEVEAFVLPYRAFNEAMGGGLRRKQMTLLGGWSSHGKSVVMDQVLEHFAKAGHRCHLYINEMGIEDRVGRSVSRHSTIPYNRLLRHELNDAERQKIKEVISHGVPYFSITECAGWSINELAYDVKSRDFDVIGIDILHLFDYESEIELARISRILNRVSKQANCHIIATVHLNELRASQTMRPRPVLRDIRGSGMLKNDADNVIFVYREQDPTTGNPLPNASIYSTKVRNGELQSVPLMLLDKSFSFQEIEY